MRKWHLVSLLFVAVSLLAFAACAVSPYQQPYPYNQGGQQSYPYGPGGGTGRGMMGSGGMMGGQGGMMGSGGMMGGGGGNYNPTPNAKPISIEQAAEAARRYLSAYRGNLLVTEVMEFAQNFYAEVEEKDTGIHATELLIDKYTGQVYPEYGPNMMWNSKYGMMSNMMGNFFSSGRPTADMPVTSNQARELAQKWLEFNLPGVGVAEADTFYGYYTLHTLKGGQVEGMLSVNGYTGAVWYHTWHGPFIGTQEFD